MKKIFKYFAFALVLTLSSCHLNDPVLFKDAFVAFDLTKSDPTAVNAKSQDIFTYRLHLTSLSRSTPLTVTVGVSCGEGLMEGRDYELISDGRVIFQQGVYDMPYRIRLLRSNLDPLADNSIMLQITQVSDPNVFIGTPQNGKNSSVKIYKRTY